jgi:hypothetical protein
MQSESSAGCDPDVVVTGKVKDRSWLIGNAAVGVSIARDFGSLGGVCFGKIVSVDETGQSPLYHVIYSDGDEEYFDRGEWLRGYELFGAMEEAVRRKQLVKRLGLTILIMQIR